MNVKIVTLVFGDVELTVEWSGGNDHLVTAKDCDGDEFKREECASLAEAFRQVAISQRMSTQQATMIFAS